MFIAGGSLIFAASMSVLALALIGVFTLGICAGSVYVLGFTLLHENVDDELRGRIFSALYTIVRMCLLIAFVIGPLLSELLDSVSHKIFTNRTLSLPGGHDLFLPGVRLTLWLAGGIIVIAGLVVVRSMGAASKRQRRLDADRV